MHQSIDVRRDYLTTDWFRFENWYPKIEQWTFKTVVLPFSLAEARTLMAYRETQRILVQAAQWQLEEAGAQSAKQSGEDNWDNNTYKAIDQDLEKYMSEEDVKNLVELKEKLDAAIRPFVQSSGGAFVKFSTRSPKDAALVGEKMKEVIKEGIEKSNISDPTSPEAYVEDIILFTRAGSLALKVTSGQEAIDLLLHSQRTYEDIKLLQLQIGEDKFDIQLIVREWCQELLPEWEFRAFVFNNQMTSCTHYYPFCFVPEILAKKKEIEERILSFWDSIKENLDTPSYTIDFALSPDLEKIWIVELNNPPPVAGPGLFDWKDEHDNKIILEGPFEFRVSEKPVDNALNRIHPPLKHFINVLRHRKDLVLTGISHLRVGCDKCNRRPVDRIWFHCNECPNYDLCASCYENETIDNPKKHPHSFSQAVSCEKETTDEVAQGNNNTPTTINNTTEDTRGEKESQQRCVIS